MPLLPSFHNPTPSACARVVMLVGFSYTPASVRRIIAVHPQATLIADNPYCCELLEALQHPYLTTEDFVPSDQLSQMGVHNYEWLDRVMADCESRLPQSMSDPKYAGMYHRGLLSRYYFTFKRILDCVHTAVLLGDAITARCAPNAIAIYTAHPHAVPYTPCSYAFHEYFYVQALAQSLGGRVTLQKTTGECSRLVTMQRWKRRVGHWRASVLNARALWRLIRRARRRTPTYVVTHANYDVAALYADLKTMGRQEDFLACNLAPLSTQWLTTSVRFLQGDFSRHDPRPRVWEMFDAVLEKYGGDVPAPVRQQFRGAVCEIVRRSYLKNLRCFQLGEIFARRACVKSAVSPCVASSAEAAFLLGISAGGGQTFHYQHGGGQGYLTKKMSTWYNAQTDNFFSYGRVVPDHQGIHPAVRVIAAGSYRLEKTKVKLCERFVQPTPPLRLLCVPSFPLYHRIYFPDGKRSDLFSYYLWRDFLQSLVANHDGMQKYSVVIKSSHFLDPSRDFFYALAARTVAQNVRVTSEGTMTQYLNDTDVLLTDNPETVLLEALLTRKPIILYLNGGYAIEPSCLAMLKRRVFCVDNAAQVIKVLSALSDDYAGEVAKKMDDAFLEYNLQKTQPAAAFLQQYFPTLRAS